MRIATWNIGGGYISSAQSQIFDLEDISYFSKELAKIKPDVVCLQEIHVSINNDQPKIIAKKMGLEFHVVESIADSHLKDGEKLSIAIISRYPIISTKFHKLPNPNLQFIWNNKKAFSHDKGLLEAVISYRGGKVRILSGHMVPFRKFDKNFLADEFKNIREKIEEIVCCEKTPTIMGADMNFEDVFKLIPNVFGQGYNFVLRDSPTTPRGRRYDKIIASKDWEFVNSKIIEGAADHFLCFADVELNFL